MKKLKQAQKQLDRALANLEHAANRLEEAGLQHQAHDLDTAGEPIERLRDVLAAL
jgi:hypothetical protein